MSWWFGGDTEGLKRRTPSGAPAPQLCKTCHALLSQCRCSQRIVTGPDGAKLCGVCKCAFDECKCAAEWGRREMARRATLEPETLVKNMCALLADTTEQLLTKTSRLSKTFEQLSEHGNLLLRQHALLAKHDGKGVLTAGLLAQHAEAVNEWMVICDRELEKSVRRLGQSPQDSPSQPSEKPEGAPAPQQRSKKFPVP